MSVEVKFEDNTIKFLNALDDEVNAWLEEAAGELESQTKRNTSVGKVGGSRTKAAWEHKVDESFLSGWIRRSSSAVMLPGGSGSPPQAQSTTDHPRFSAA